MDNTTTTTATFWTWFHDRWQGILLEPGQEVTMDEGGPTDEGWQSSGCQWSMDAGGVVMFERWHDGRDCDGRSGGEWSGVLAGLRPQGDRCAYRVHPDGWREPVENLAYPHVLTVAVWDEADSSCYDRFAEAAGY